MADWQTKNNNIRALEKCWNKCMSVAGDCWKVTKYASVVTKNRCQAANGLNDPHTLVVGVSAHKLQNCTDSDMWFPLLPIPSVFLWYLHQLSGTLCLHLLKVPLPSPHSRHIWKQNCSLLHTTQSNVYSAAGASDSNSRHTAPPINVFDIWHFITLGHGLHSADLTDCATHLDYHALGLWILVHTVFVFPFLPHDAL